MARVIANMRGMMADPLVVLQSKRVKVTWRVAAVAREAAENGTAIAKQLCT